MGQTSKESAEESSRKWSLTAIGIGAIIGGGILLVTELVNIMQVQALALSFVIAGIACVFYSTVLRRICIDSTRRRFCLCFMLYGTETRDFRVDYWMGLILEYAMGSMTVAVSWSGYFGKLLKMFGFASSSLVNYRSPNIFSSRKLRFP